MAAASVAASIASALDAPLFRALQTSMAQNQMVEFARYAQLATIAVDGHPSVRSINMRGLSEMRLGGLSRGALRFSTDSRSAKVAEFAAAARRMEQQQQSAAAASLSPPVVELCWFFPVTREQYRLRCHVQLVFSEGHEPSTVPGAAAATPVSASFAPAAAASADPFPSSLLRRSPEDQSAHLAFWRSHSPEARQGFELAHPGSIKLSASQGDLDRFAPQPADENTPGQHFVSVYLLPLRGDVLKLPRPAEDTRGKITRVQHHESTLQPARSQRRWAHSMDEHSGEWKTVELNP